MIAETQRLLDEYVRWIKDKTVLRDLGNAWVEITTPSLDRHNDALQIFIRREDDGYVLSDDGYILTDLAASGCPLDSLKRKTLLNQVLAGFGVRQDGEQLVIRATPMNFPEKKHCLLQAMATVNDMFFLSAPQVESIFYEDVVRWFDLSEVRYSAQVKLQGRTGYNHNFDFLIPKSRQQPERIVQTLTNPNKNAVESLMFKWLDTKDIRPTSARLIALLNDAVVPVAQNVSDAFANYDVLAVSWSKRENIRDELVA